VIIHHGHLYTQSGEMYPDYAHELKGVLSNYNEGALHLISHASIDLFSQGLDFQPRFIHIRRGCRLLRQKQKKETK